MRGLSIAVLLCGACTFTWNDAAPSLPLIGDPPALSSFVKLNAQPVGRAAPLGGNDGTPWAAFCEFWSMGSGNNGRSCKRMHLTRLGAPEDAPVDEVFEADSFGLHYWMLYAVKDDPAAPDAMARTVTLHRPGDPRVSDVAFVLPGGRASFVINDGGNADVFLYWVEDTATTEWTIHRRDQAYARHLPIPAGVDPANQSNEQLAIALDRDGDTLVVRLPDGSATAYSTLDEGAVPLGTRPRDFFFDEARARVVFFGMDGLRAVDRRTAEEVVLSADAIDPATVSVTSTAVYYATAAGLWQVPLDGSAAPALVASPAARLRAVGPNGEIAYSLDPSTLYSGGAGDGWLGDWKFMERGRFLRFSADGARLHFLEHAATLGTYGDLTTATSPDVPNRLLSVNVHQWDELPDGRLVAVENAIQRGAWNRMVVIDEQAGTRRWMVPSATDYFLVPGGRELVVDVVSGASGYDVLRVPAPD